MSQERVSSDRKVKVIPCRGDRDGEGKNAGTNSGKSSMRGVFV